MELVKGSKYRENYKKLETIGFPYNVEISIINGRIKDLNEEHYLFINNTSNKIKSIIFNEKNSYIKKEDILNKYNLINLCNELKINKINEINNRISLYTINNLYLELTDKLYALMILIEMIYVYKKSNYKINGLYSNYKYNKGFNSLNYLFNKTDDLLAMINNVEIIELGKKMYFEYLEKREYREKNIDYIKEYENRIMEECLNKKDPQLIKSLRK